MADYTLGDFLPDAPNMADRRPLNPTIYEVVALLSLCVLPSA